MPQTRLPTRYGPSPATGPVAATALEKIAPATNTRTNVPMISLNRFAIGLQIAGAVQKQARFKSASGVTRQWGRKCSHTRHAPTMAPAICAAMYGPTLLKSPERIAAPRVTAGFRWPSPPQAIAVNTPAITATAHPVEITIHPAPSALDFLSRTLATTPLPRRINTMVPMNSRSEEHTSEL